MEKEEILKELAEMNRVLDLPKDEFQKVIKMDLEQHDIWAAKVGYVKGKLIILGVT